ncbi:MAG: hypothetical protein LAP13_12340 [Acidobacteriia bacterium]|nr:hypothetical protein [Terriglobia bacterium]
MRWAHEKKPDHNWRRQRTRGLARAGFTFATILAIGSFFAPSFLNGDGPAFSDTVRAEISPAASRALESKLQILSGNQPSDPSKPVVITEGEANSYLRYHAREFFPPGVSEPTIRILPGGVYGAAAVNFEEFGRSNPNSKDWGPKVLAAMFKGKQRVAAIGSLTTANGQGTVKIETVSIGTTKIPDWLVDYVVENYLQPRYHFDLSKPFPLPDHVSRIELSHGQAAFVRSPQKETR